MGTDRHPTSRPVQGPVGMGHTEDMATGEPGADREAVPQEAPGLRPVCLLNPLWVRYSGDQSGQKSLCVRGSQ